MFWRCVQGTEQGTCLLRLAAPMTSRIEDEKTKLCRLLVETFRTYSSLEQGINLQSASCLLISSLAILDILAPESPRSSSIVLLLSPTFPLEARCAKGRGIVRVQKLLTVFGRANLDSNVYPFYEVKHYLKELQLRRLHKSWDFRGETIDSTNDEALSRRGENSSELQLLRIRYKGIIDREHIRGSVDFEML